MAKRKRKILIFPKGGTVVELNKELPGPVDDLIKNVAASFGVSARDVIISPRRTNPLSQARFCVAGIMRNRWNFTLQRIADLCAAGKHDTIIYRVKQAQVLQETDKHFALVYARLAKQAGDAPRESDVSLFERYAQAVQGVEQAMRTLREVTPMIEALKRRAEAGESELLRQS